MRLRLTPYASVAIQMGLAVAAAIAAGDALSGQRFYWAMIARFASASGAMTTSGTGCGPRRSASGTCFPGCWAKASTTTGSRPPRR
jgi:hypothetical protein